MNVFEDLVREMSEALNLPLHAEKGRLCKLKIGDKLHVQLEFDENRGRLLIGSFLGEVPAGRFREEIFKQALKINRLFPRLGTFGYVERSNQLSLFTHIPLPIVGTLFMPFFFQFVDLAEVWRSSIESGRIPS